MLKLCFGYCRIVNLEQPPSGGCVLKRLGQSSPNVSFDDAATFGWLCVETDNMQEMWNNFQQPPSGGCVLKHKASGNAEKHRRSHLRVAVC